jgi:hypothetical protein
LMIWNVQRKQKNADKLYLTNRPKKWMGPAGFEPTTIWL